MSIYATQFRWVRRLAAAALTLDVVACLAAFAYGAWLLGRGDGLVGIELLCIGAAALIIGTLLYCLIVLAHKFVSNSYRAYDTLLDMSELIRRQGEYAHTMAENITLSEWAKKIVYREKDYEFLRDTIHAAIVRQDWESAEHLISELDREFGRREEAHRLRDELAAARRATVEERVAAALKRFEALCDAHKWEQARGEVARLQVLFDGDARIAGLPQELELRRQEHKRRLLKEYDQAIRMHDVDRAHRLLFTLDRYLAPQEAAALKESARGVFKAKLLQVGVQFELAVTEKDFRKALQVGEQLIREFPNSRYAQQISEMMPVLRRRATALVDHEPAPA
jgi:hypothetical protein